MAHILGIGTDIIECLRIAQMIERHGELFITRVYTQHEIQYCQSRKQATQHYAGRWAAKEAVLKALGTGWRRGISCATSRFATTRPAVPESRCVGEPPTSSSGWASRKCTSAFPTAAAMPRPTRWPRDWSKLKKTNS